jgi:thioredoxin 1
MAQIVEITDATFDSEVMQAEGLVALEFYASVCPVCRRLAPVFEELSNDYAGKGKFAKADVAQTGESARKLVVMSVPTVLLVKGGREVDRSVGYVDKKKLARLLDAHL